MSYVVQDGQRIRERVHFAGLGRARARGGRGGRTLAGSGGVLRGGIFGSLGATSGEGVSFEIGCVAARAALVALAAAGKALERAATSAAQQGIGTEVFEFATGGAWRGLARAVETRDVVKLRSLQDQIKNIASLAASELRDAAVTRYVGLFIFPADAFATPEDSEQIRDLIETPPPGFPDVGKGMPWYFWAGIGTFFVVTGAVVLRPFVR